MKSSIKLVVTIIALFCIVGTVFVGVAEATGKKPLQAIWNAIYALQNRMNGVETTLSQVKTIRFYTSNETMTNDTSWKDAAVFKWTPKNPTNNVINTYGAVYFQYLTNDSNDYQFVFRILINNIEVTSGSTTIYSTTYQQSDLWGFGINTNPVGYKPNQSTYIVKFQVHCSTNQGRQYVKNINIIMEAMDGLPPS